MLTSIIVTSPSRVELFPRQRRDASFLGPRDRIHLSLQALAHTEPITSLASRHGVSRKFVYQQAAKATEGLAVAFDPPPDDRDVLFHLPVTKDWIEQLVLGLVLICHSSFRGVIELLEAVFDYRSISLGTVHNIVNSALAKAQQINDSQDLSSIRVGIHDEIYQAGKPVLVGVHDVSTYCYLLSYMDDCGETSWGVSLLDLVPQGFNPDYTIADQGTGLRAGQAAALPATPCHGDVFHAEYNFSKLVSFLQNRACVATTARKKLEANVERLKKRGKKNTFGPRLAAARKAEATAQNLAHDIKTLAEWMRDDILSLAGPCPQVRRELFDFIVQELENRETLCPHRIASLRRSLQKQRDDLLAFADILDAKFQDIAARFNIPLFLVHRTCELAGLDKSSSLYWQRKADLHNKLPGVFHGVHKAVLEAMAETPRASSLVENLNSRLRNYFFLRRHIGNGYLHLLRFFLNHRRFLRSERPERVAKSPAELLTGESHPHWLELLGLKRFQRN